MASLRVIKLVSIGKPTSTQPASELARCEVLKGLES
jgi:hypothetical protein